jgi:HEAT repeat protein
MKNFYRQMACYLVLLTVLSSLNLSPLSVAASDTEIAERSNKEGLGNLKTMKLEDQMTLIEKLSKEKSDLQSVLISQLEPTAPKEAIFNVAYLLGLYRMEKSVGSLSKFISLKNDTLLSDRESAWGQYPVAEALIKIGHPSIVPMIENLETSDDELVRKLSVQVILYVEDPEVTKFIIERAIKKQTDEKKQHRLQSALKFVTMP